MAERTLRYDVVDVFTDQPFAGNQLAVVHGAQDLTATQCLALAREFNYAETTFPVAAADGTSYTVRIFTPGGEIPFAGHPTLGTAWVLREKGLVVGEEVVQHCGAGDIEVRLDSDLVELSATPRDLLGPVDVGDDLVAAVLADVGLAPSDVAGPVWLAGCGLTFLHIPVNAEAVDRAVASPRPLSQYAARLAALGTAVDPVEGINLHHAVEDDGHVDVRSRVFVPGLSVPEDAATGSSAAGLGMTFVAAGLLEKGGSYTITQGVEMGRPSRLFGRVDVEDGRAVRCHVAGQVCHVARGEIAVP
jgi:trans-2,3-dihydro-3-hydroxyanthranilate isomerase